MDAVIPVPSSVTKFKLAYKVSTLAYNLRGSIIVSIKSMTGYRMILR
jgi:hypothetical protein